MFRICSDPTNLGKGFHMTFANGKTISVQFGRGNYCDNDSQEHNYPNLYSRDAEVMVGS